VGVRKSRRKTKRKKGLGICRDAISRVYVEIRS
jgi:hypothetical protein